MRIGIAIATLLLAGTVCKAQTAMDFNRVDCNGANHHLFADLDAGKVVILEFFMGPNCTSCMDAAQEIEGMKTKLLMAHPGKIMTYALGFQDNYSCSLISNWVSSQSLTAIPMDSGEAQVAHYGGFSMPTIVVLAGTSHGVIYSANPNNGGYTPGDTSSMSSSIKNFFNPTGVQPIASVINSVSVYPNPANATAHIQLEIMENTELSIQVLSLTGQVVADVVNEKVDAGSVVKTIPVEKMTSGSYVVRITANGISTYRKLDIVR